MLGSCKNYCTNRIPIVQFNNYDSSRLTDVTVYSYTKDGSFSDLAFTRHYSTTPDRAIGDTFFIDNKLNNIILDPSYDHVIMINEMRQSLIFGTSAPYFSIKGISLNHDENKDIYCTSSMSYYLNEKYYTIPKEASRDLPGYIQISL